MSATENAAVLIKLKCCQCGLLGSCNTWTICTDNCTNHANILTLQTDLEFVVQTFGVKVKVNASYWQNLYTEFSAHIYFTSVVDTAKTSPSHEPLFLNTFAIRIHVFTLECL